ncbi:hypothetical protein [Parashewanella tropica]|uniref:hypothetical protein n=1 Tax=Parashewanella tropica TaxID=2547970 RepID=UPI00105A8F9C|nr:hypothetical protein [Parashewanella tropica]
MNLAQKTNQPQGCIIPEGWVILKITNDEENPFYKVFSSWDEPFQDKWRLSSGADLCELVENEKAYIWPQSSGSVYWLPKGAQGNCTLSNSQKLEEFLRLDGVESVELNSGLISQDKEELQ